PGPLEKALRGFALRTTEEILCPQIGLCFDSLPEAYEYYNLYSWEVGFGIRYSRSKSYKCKSGPRKDVVYKTVQHIVCGSQGFPQKQNTSSVRCGCKAMIRLLRSEDHGWYIKECKLQHNHKLSRNRGEKLCWPSHKHIDQCTRELVRNLRENNVPPTKVYSILGTYFGSTEDIPFNKRSLQNLCKQISKEEANDDVRKTMDIFTKMRDEDPSFVHTADLDSDGRIRTLIWVNGKSKLDYRYFGDAITFDTTYKTNLYGMPFGLFVGVNNHFQSIIFSGVLMRQETIESFEWIFREFTSLMGGKPPVTILTGFIVNSTHKCIHFQRFRIFREKGACSYWAVARTILYHIVSSFEIECHTMYILYVPYYLHICHLIHVCHSAYCLSSLLIDIGIFCAKMTSTQRSESANHMLKGYVPPGAPMHLFVKQYNKLIADRISKEDSENQRTRMGEVVLKTGWPIEKHVATVYTSAMLEMFSDRIFDSAAYNVVEVEVNKKYMTIHSDASKREKWSKVHYDVTISDDGGQYHCECGLAEHMGMLCCHSIRVMLRLGVDKIPQPHILKRWTKDANDVLPDYLAHLQKDRGSTRSQSFRHASLHVAALELVAIGEKNVDCYHDVLNYMKDGTKKFGEMYQQTDGRSLQDLLLAPIVPSEVENCSNVVPGLLHAGALAPVRNRPVGRPTNTRDKPSYEHRCVTDQYCL
ncbi:hypothetical protein BRADI_3g20427v3, partial [Brachypodium distachyon]